MQRYKEFIIQTNFFDEKVNSGALSAFLDQKTAVGKSEGDSFFPVKVIHYIARRYGVKFYTQHEMLS